MQGGVDAELYNGMQWRLREEQINVHHKPDDNIWHSHLNMTPPPPKKNKKKHMDKEANLSRFSIWGGLIFLINKMCG